MKLLLAFLAAGKLGKLALSSGSMVLSIWVYAMRFGWAYAAGLVALLLVHEMGHFLAARQRGLAVGLPMFIPFVGAWVTLDTTGLTPETQAEVALAGPMLGTLAAFVCFLYAQHSGSPLWMAIAYAGFMLNLFNLIPVMPLDGGHIVALLSPKLWGLGLALLVGVFWWRPSPLLVVVAVLAVPQVWSAWRGTASPRAAVSRSLRIQYSLQYFLLVCALSVLALEAHGSLGR